MHLQQLGATQGVLTISGNDFSFRRATEVVITLHSFKFIFKSAGLVGTFPGVVWTRVENNFCPGRFHPIDMNGDNAYTNTSAKSKDTATFAIPEVVAR